MTQLGELTFYPDPSKRIFPACSEQPCIYAGTKDGRCKKHQIDN